MVTRILLIEDDIKATEQIKAFVLKHKDMELIDRPSPDRDILSCLIEENPNCLMLDYDVAHKSGRRYAEYIKNHLPKMRLILMMNNPDFAQAQKALNHCKADYILQISQINDEILLQALNFSQNHFNKDNIEDFYKDKLDKLLEKYNELALYILHEEVVAGVAENRIVNAERNLGVNLDFNTEEFYLGFSGFSTKVYSKYSLDRNEFNQFFKSLRIKIRNIGSESYKTELFMHSTTKNFILIVSRKPLSKERESIYKIIEHVHSLIQYEFQEKISKGRIILENFTSVSEKLSGLGTHISDAFQNIIRLKQLSFFIYEESIINQEDIENLRIPVTIETVNSIIENIRGALLSGQRAKLECSFKTLFIEKLKYSFNTLLCSYSLDYLKQIYIKESEGLGLKCGFDLEKMFIVDEYITIESVYHRLLEAFNGIQDILITKTSHRSIIINKAVSYINQNYANKLTLKDISDYVCISSSYLCRMFKQETGESLNQFITKVRVKNAIKLMDNTGYRIWEVCEKSGFPNSKYFSQVFKKIVGMTPREYKENKEKDSFVI